MSCLTSYCLAYELGVLVNAIVSVRNIVAREIALKYLF